MTLEWTSHPKPRIIWTEGPRPDPDLEVVVLVTTSLQSAHLIAGRLETEGIRAMVAPSGSGMGPWVGLPASGSSFMPLGLAPMGGGNQPSDVLIEASDLAAARAIMQHFDEPFD